MHVELMNRIENTGSRLEKEKLLSHETDTRFLVWTLDPMITFGVTADVEILTSLVGGSTTTAAKWWDQLDELLNLLYSRRLTGNAALNAIDHLMLKAPSTDDVLWACRVINKDLRCGVQISTANKAFPGLISPFSVMLAAEYDPEKHDVGGYFVEPKLDGLRMMVAEGRAYTRNGRSIETVGHILEELAQFKDYVFDGEVMGVDDFDASSGATRRKNTGVNKSLTYHVFDAFLVDEWKARKVNRGLEARKAFLGQLFMTVGFKHVKQVPHQRLPDRTTFEMLEKEFRDKMVAEGYEGCMLKDPKAHYIFKRSDSLLKFKPFLDADGTIVDFQEGKGRHRGRLGALFVEFDGVVTRVGSGFNDAMRDHVWNSKELYRGAVAECKYQNKTPDGKLRFPVFIRFRGDKD
jgi:DNA ligase-1